MQIDELCRRINTRRLKVPFVQHSSYEAWRAALAHMAAEYKCEVVLGYNNSEIMAKKVCESGADPDAIWAVFVLCFPDA